MRFKNFEVTGQLHKTMRREACKPRAQNKAKKAIERRAAAAECTRVIYTLCLISGSILVPRLLIVVRLVIPTSI